VRAELMGALYLGGTAARDLALAVLRDHSEPPAVRAAAAWTLGCTSVGEPETTAALVSALRDDHPDVVVGALEGLALSVPSRAEDLAAELVHDSRVTTAGKTVGAAVAEEVEALRRRCR
jgi:hypothetical protein